jgi:hypothetical protein
MDGQESIRTHDLKELLPKAEISIPDEEKSSWGEDLPKLLTEAIYWFGRYPIPISIKHKSFEEQPWVCMHSDKDNIDRFYKYLWEQRPEC